MHSMHLLTHFISNICIKGAVCNFLAPSCDAVERCIQRFTPPLLQYGGHDRIKIVTCLLQEITDLRNTLCTVCRLLIVITWTHEGTVVQQTDLGAAVKGDSRMSLLMLSLSVQYEADQKHVSVQVPEICPDLPTRQNACVSLFLCECFD